MTALLAERSLQLSEMEKTSGLSATSSKLALIAQYDIGRSSVTDFNPKASRDTFYTFDAEKGKHLGDIHTPVSFNIGECAWNTKYKPPAYGGKSEVRNFYDKSHLGNSAF
eukprot:gene26753-33381_t